jgi:hypothetical protein
MSRSSSTHRLVSLVIATVASILLSAAFLSSQASAATGASPAPPSNLHAAGVSQGIQLTWRDSSNNETAWIIYDGLTQKYLVGAHAGVGGNVTYTWGGMKPSEYKCFMVRAYNAWGASAWTPGWGCNRAKASSAAPAVDRVESWCYGNGGSDFGTNLSWFLPSTAWDSFKVYKNGTLIQQLTRVNENNLVLAHYTDLNFGYQIKTGARGATFAVSIVKSNIESSRLNANPVCS